MLFTLAATVALFGLIAWVIELLPVKPADDHPRPHAEPIACLPALSGLLLAVIAIALGLAKLPHGIGIAVGCAAGGIVTLIATLIEDRQCAKGQTSTLAPIGAAVVLTALAALLKSEQAYICGGAILGSGLIAGLAGRSSATITRTAATSTTLLLAIATAALLLAHMRPEPRLDVAVPLTLGLIALTGMIVRTIGSFSVAAARLQLLIGAVLIGVAGMALMHYLDFEGSRLLPLFAGVTALILGLLLPEEPSAAPGPALLGTLIVIAVSTVAFGLAQGTGMALTGLLCIGLLIASGRHLAAVAASPAALLCWHRVLQEYGGMLNSTLNPNQQYILIGLLLGAGVPALLAMQTHDDQPDGTNAWWWLPVAMLGTLIAIATPLLLADRAATGFLAGAAIAPFIGLIATPSARAVAAMAPMSAVTAFLTVALVPAGLLLTRDEKIIWLLMLGGLGLLLALPLALRRPRPMPVIEAEVSA